MPKIKKISDYCHSYREPVFLTKDGRGDLAVMGLETYDELIGRLELYQAIETGLDQIKRGEIITEKQMMKNLNRYIGK